MKRKAGREWEKLKKHFYIKTKFSCQECGKKPRKIIKSTKNITYFQNYTFIDSYYFLADINIIERISVFEPHTLHLHHIKPLSEGGAEFEESNLILLCPPCHIKKHTK